MLAQRNAALRSGGPPRAARAWDQLLAKAGAQVTSVRHQRIAAWRKPFALFYETIAGGETAALAYKPDLGGGRPGTQRRYGLENTARALPATLGE